VSDFLKRIADFSPKRLLLLAAELEERVRALEEEKAGRNHEPIAIIGMGCRFPGGVHDAESFWDLLAEGRDAVSEVPKWRWDLEKLYDPDPHAKGKVATCWGGFIDSPEMFDSGFFGIAPIEAVSMDPQQRLLLEVSWEALEDAGIAPSTLNGSKTGVYMGLCNSDYVQLAMNVSSVDLDAYFATGASHAVAAGRISYFLGLRGPSMAIDTACSASLVAVHEACQGLRLGESDLALAGGVNLVLIPEITMALSRAQMMSSDGRCKAFSADANGFVRGEGCGVVVLKRLDDAQQDGDRVLAVIRGTAINQDGRSSGLTAPNGPSQVDVIRAALKDAGLVPEAVSYVEAHGTGTSLGDTIEMQALGEAVGSAGEGRAEDERLPVGSVKSNFGHAESAAGVAGLIKVALALQHRTIPASLHCSEPNPAIDWESNKTRVPVVAEAWRAAAGQQLRVGAVSSFGFSGTNAHMVVSEAPDAAILATALIDADDEEGVRVITLSARSERALQTMAARLADCLRRQPNLRLQDVAHTLAVGRSSFAYRAAMRPPSIPHLIEELARLSQGDCDCEFARGVVETRAPRVAFLFAGQGGEHSGMGLSLLRRSEEFGAAVAEVDAALRGVIAAPIESIFRNEKNELAQSALVQPALYAFQYGLTRLWQSWGVEPHIVVGHSMGELVAATIAGVMTVEDAARLVAARGRLTGELGDAGGMVAVAAAEEQVLSVLAKYAQGTYANDVSIAAINGPTSVVISGRAEAVELAAQEFERAGVRVKRLNITYGSHSPAMRRVLPAFYEEAAKFQYHAPRLPIIADLTGEKVEDDSVFHAQYWTEHLSRPVQFSRCLERLEKEGCGLCIEMGPRAVLTAFGRERGDAKTRWVASANGRDEDFDALQGALAEAFTAGVALNWKAVFRESHARKVALPTYPFERERYWITDQDTSQDRSQDDDLSRKPARERLLAAQASGVELRPVAEDATGDNGEGWLYKQAWEPRPLADIGAKAAKSVRDWIVLGQPGGVAGLVVNGLIALGENAEIWNDFNPDKLDSASPLRSEFIDLRCLDLNHLEDGTDAHMPPTNHDPETETDLVHAEATGNLAVSLTTASLQLWQHVLRTSGGLWLFTQGAQAARAASHMAGVVQAPLWGLARCATLEHPQTLRRMVDLDPANSAEQKAAIILGEILSGDEEEQVAYTGATRLAFRVRRVEGLGEPGNTLPLLRKEGSYLLTGGLGGLGLRVAAWLGKQGVGKLVLTTRSLTSVTARQDELEAMRANGVDIVIVQADVADGEVMRRLLARFGEDREWPPLRGVFHMAMGTPTMASANAGTTTGDTTVEGIEPEQIRTVFHAKVAGTCILRELTRILPLDFFVAFSSTAALLGASHLAHYAAANSFVDAMVTLPVSQGSPMISINWGAWQTIRLASEEVQQRYSSGGLLPMRDNVALSWLGRLLHGELRQVAVAHVNWQMLVPMYEARRPRQWLEHMRPHESLHGLSTKTQWSAESGEDRLIALERAVRKEAARVLGLRRGELPGSNVRLADLGLDSLMAVTLRNRLQAMIGHGLPATFAFEFPTPAEMASALDMLLWGTVVAEDGHSTNDPFDQFDKSTMERDEIQI
jgi:acyl transferase domain-containing protein